MENEIPDGIEEVENFVSARHSIKLSDYAYGTLNTDGIDFKFEFATLRSRIAAYLIDCVILIIPIFIVDFTLADSKYITSQFEIALINLLIWTLYYGITESSKEQATIGKNAMGIKVINEEGERLSFQKAVLRFLASGFSFACFGLGILVIATDDKKQGWHDMLTGCYVIKVLKSSETNE